MFRLTKKVLAVSAMMSLLALPAAASAQSIFARAGAIMNEAGSTLPLMLAIFAGLIGGGFILWAIILAPKLGNRNEGNKGGIAVLMLLLIIAGGSGISYGFITGLAAYTVADRAPTTPEGLRRFD